MDKTFRLAKSKGPVLVHSKFGRRAFPTSFPFEVQDISSEVTLPEAGAIENLADDSDFGVEEFVVEAIRNADVGIVFQPIVRFVEGRASVFMFEALARWESPDGGPIAPSLAHMIAEELGVTSNLTEMLFRKSLQELALMSGAPDSIGLSFNMTAAQICEPGMAENLRSVMEEFSFDPSRLMIEVSEEALPRDASEISDVLRPLQHIGVRVALDDFGAGATSLSFLTQICVDVIKMDKAFVKGVRNSATQREILVSLGQLCWRLGLVSIVEGVETHEDYEILKASGYHCFQGYFFSVPMTAEAFKAENFKSMKFPSTTNVAELRNRSAARSRPLNS